MVTDRLRRPAAIYADMALAGRMVREPIRSLPPEVWDEFVETLKRGPTPEQARAVKRAKELARHIPLVDSSTVKNKRICNPSDIVRRVEAGACDRKS